MNRPVIASIFKPFFLEKIAKTLFPMTFWGTLICLSLGSYYGLFQSPPDYQQGEMVRFLYLHVPASWFALMIYGIMAITSLIGYFAKLPLAHVLVKAMAIPGTLLTGISLITGSLWGKPIWGTYWVWDARLTSMFILFFIYLGYISLVYTKRTNIAQLHRLSLFVAIGGFNLPIIKWSVDFWFTLHQPPSIMRFGKPALDPAFFTPLLWMTGAYFCFVLTMTALLYLCEVQKLRLQKIKEEEMMRDLKQRIAA